MHAFAHGTLKRVLTGLLAMLALVPCTGFAEAGRIIATNGENHLDRNQQVVKPLRNGTPVMAGDAAITAPGGRLQIRFADGALVSMQPGTRFRIDAHRFTKKEERSFFTLLRGAVRMASGLIGKKREQDFRLQTPSATIGIRGTHFVVEHTVCDPDCFPGKQAGTRVTVTDGRVVVANAAGTVELGKHQSALIRDQQSAPETIAWVPVMQPRQMQSPQLAGPGPAQPVIALPGAETRDESGDREEPDQDPFEPVAGSPLPGIADNQRRNASGQFPELAMGKPSPGKPSPGNPGDNPSDDINDTPPGDNNEPGNNTGGETGGETGEQPGDEPTAGDPPDGGNPGPGDPTPGQPSTPSLPGPAPGTSDATEWLFSLQPLHGMVRTGVQQRTGYELTFDNNTGLLTIGRCNNGVCLSRGSAQLAEAGHDDYAAWGRWTNGTIELSVFGLRTGIELSARQGLHYLAGTPAVSLPASGAFSYTLTAATAPTMSHDWYDAGQFSGRAGVWFAPGQAARVGFEATVTLAGDPFSFATHGGADDPASSQLSLNANQQFAGVLTTTNQGTNLPWMCHGQGCTTDVRGGLFGPSGERLGLSYSIRSESESTTIDGVSIFSRPPPSP